MGELDYDERNIEALAQMKGKVIRSVVIITEDPDEYDEGNALVFEFEDGSRGKMYDAGQSCCESRWMHTDDDLEYYAGATLLDAEVADGDGSGDEDEEEFETKESQFLKVKTSKGVFTVVNYVEHNGYYGGFSLRLKMLEPGEES